MVSNSQLLLVRIPTLLKPVEHPRLDLESVYSRVTIMTSITFCFSVILFCLYVDPGRSVIHTVKFRVEKLEIGISPRRYCDGAYGANKCDPILKLWPVNRQSVRFSKAYAIDLSHIMTSDYVKFRKDPMLKGTDFDFYENGGVVFIRQPEIVEQFVLGPKHNKEYQFVWDLEGGNGNYSFHYNLYDEDDWWSRDDFIAAGQIEMKGSGTVEYSSRRYHTFKREHSEFIKDCLSFFSMTIQAVSIRDPAESENCTDECRRNNCGKYCLMACQGQPECPTKDWCCKG